MDAARRHAVAALEPATGHRPGFVEPGPGVGARLWSHCRQGLLGPPAGAQGKHRAPATARMVLRSPRQTGYPAPGAGRRSLFCALAALGLALVAVAAHPHDPPGTGGAVVAGGRGGHLVAGARGWRRRRYRRQQYGARCDGGAGCAPSCGPPCRTQQPGKQAMPSEKPTLVRDHRGARPLPHTHLRAGRKQPPR